MIFEDSKPLKTILNGIYINRLYPKTRLCCWL